eukprot:5681460-Amphidinium_carterae.1
MVLLFRLATLHKLSKLWKPGSFRLRKVVTDDASALSASTIACIIKHCLVGKAWGADRWGVPAAKDEFKQRCNAALE